MEGRSIEALLSRAMRVSDGGKSNGIGCAVSDDLAVIYVDFSKPVAQGLRSTGLILPPNTMIDGPASFIYTKAPVVGTFEAFLNVAGDLTGAVANAPIGFGAPMPRVIAGPTGAEVKITSAAPINSGIIAIYLRLVPLP